MNRAFSVNGLSSHIKHTAKRRLSYGHGKWCTGIDRLTGSGNSVCGRQGNTANFIFAQLLHHFHQNDSIWQPHFHRIIHFRDFSCRKLNINNRPNHLGYNCFFHGCLHCQKLVFLFVQYSCATRNLCNFCCNGCLSCMVQFQSERSNQVICIIRGRCHSRHSGSMLTDFCLQ